MSTTASSFQSFTKKYSLSKTLRFELKPYGEIPEEEKQKYDNCSTFTQYHLNRVNQEYYDEKNNDLELVNFLRDQEIEDAYQVLKPVFDKIHEEFITQSLENEEARKIDISKYLKFKEELLSIDKKSDIYEKKLKDIESEEKKLRKDITKLYEIIGEEFIKTVGNNDKGKPILKEKNFKVLTESGILSYIRANMEYFSSLKLETREEISWKKENKNLVEKSDLEKAIGNVDNKGIFERFFTYFSGFNQNRENYYSDEEKSTAVSYRIVNENLPKFVDNIFLFEKQKDEYIKIYGDLKNANKELKIKDKKGNEKEVIKFYDEIFEINTFVNCLSQKQIDEYNEKIGDNNFLINLYNQLHSKTEGFKKLPQFKILYKQIGCGEKNDFVKIIKSDDELKEKLKEIRIAGEKYFTGESKEGEKKHTIDDFINILQNRENYEGIYWNKQAINTISGKYFANWHDLEDRLVKEKVFKEDKKSDEKIKIPEAVELSMLFAVLDEEKDSETSSEGQNNWKKSGFFFKTSLFEGEKNEKNIQIIQKSENPSTALLSLILNDLKESTERFLINNTVIENGIVKIVDFKSDNEKAKIKLWLDETLVVNRVLKYFITKENKRKGHQQDSDVENLLKVLIFDFDWFKNYDGIRNYLTKKPQSEINKLKLNFENSTLAAGWDVNKEKDNYCIILQDENKNQYLAILQDKNKKIFEQTKNNEIYEKDSYGWEKMNYKLVPGPNKMLPKVLLPNSNRLAFGATDEILKIYDNGGFKIEERKIEENEIIDINKLKQTYFVSEEKNKENKTTKVKLVHKDNLRKIIDFYKNGLRIYPNQNDNWNQIFNFQFSETNDYKSIDSFYSDVEKQGYKLDFVSINKSKLDSYIKEGKIYLFQIKNQDYNQNKKDEHKNNLHTLYWKSIFGNSQNKAKLNGEAEIFFRPALKNPEKIQDKKGKEIIKNFRYSKEKFVFHCPITLNFCLKSTRLNDELNKELTKSEISKDICFLGIDRGEKHLAYYSLVNQRGEILKQGTLNIPFLDENKKPRSIKVEKKSFFRDTSGNIEKDKKGNEKIKTEIVECWNYNDLLEARSGDRDFARKNWQTIGTIKELKDGYISQVVRKIVDLSIEHNAFIVLENLNSGFKNSRKKIEKQVYQKLELALAKKLNFVVNKTVKSGDFMSVENALQLTPPVDNFGDIEKAKQYGIMLYTRANYTSQTDPKTGWRKSIYLKKGSEENIKAQICENFDEFGFDGQDYYFKYTDKNAGKEWRLYSGINGNSLERYRGKLNNDTAKWEINLVDINTYLDKLFVNYGKGKEFKFTIQKAKKDKQGKIIETGKIIDFQGKGIELVKIEDKNLNKEGHTAWETFRYVIELIQQIRNSGEKGDKRNEDFILSPIRDEKTGKHFDSRDYYREDGNYEDVKEIVSGDANGAYNIARKGVMMFDRIKEKPEKPELFIRDEEWDKVVSDWDNFTQR